MLVDKCVWNDSVNSRLLQNIHLTRKFTKAAQVSLILTIKIIMYNRTRVASCPDLQTAIEII